MSAVISVVLQHLVDARLLDVEDLAAQREDGLRRAVAALLGRAAGGVALDDEELGQRRVLDRAVGELAGQAHAAHAPTCAWRRAPCGRRRAPGRLTPPCGSPRAPPAGSPRGTGPSFWLTTEATKPSMPGLPSLVLVWPSNCGSVSLTEMTAVSPSRTSSPERFSSFSLSSPVFARVGVERARERGAEARQVRAALVRVDVVREREDGLLVGGVPLQRDLDRALVGLAGEEDDLLLDRVLVLVQERRRSPRSRRRTGTRRGGPRRARPRSRSSGRG